MNFANKTDAGHGASGTYWNNEQAPSQQDRPRQSRALVLRDAFASPDPNAPDGVW